MRNLEAPGRCVSPGVFFLGNVKRPNFLVDAYRRLLIPTGCHRLFRSHSANWTEHSGLDNAQRN
jgi:hypothetical protein